MKINKITFYNYKAFYSPSINDVYTLEIPDGKNLLIYGENGSGKSSIFEGLKDLFQSSINLSQNFNQNKFSFGKIPAQPEPFVSINFDNDPTEYIYSIDSYNTNTISYDHIMKSNTSKSLLSYKELLKTHFIKEKEELNLFDLMVGENGIISNVKNPSGLTANRSEGTFGFLWSDIKRRAASNRHSYDYWDLSSFPIIEDFNIGLERFLDLLGGDINNLLAEFDPNFQLEKFEYTSIQHNDVRNVPDRLKNYKIKPIIKFYNEKIVNHSSFLNEARLTALAISIYFASLMEVPDPPYKLLFLDDIFIGLDNC
jgi:predicted ATP-dependent endonuclease of OLD family